MNEKYLTLNYTDIIKTYLLERLNKLKNTKFDPYEFYNLITQELRDEENFFYNKVDSKKFISMHLKEAEDTYNFYQQTLNPISDAEIFVAAMIEKSVAELLQESFAVGYNLFCSNKNKKEMVLTEQFIDEIKKDLLLEDVSGRKELEPEVYNIENIVKAEKEKLLNQNFQKSFKDITYDDIKVTVSDESSIFLSMALADQNRFSFNEEFSLKMAARTDPFVDIKEFFNNSIRNIIHEEVDFSASTAGYEIIDECSIQAVLNDPEL